VYGLVVWLGFELGIAPVLGHRQATRAVIGAAGVDCVDGSALSMPCRQIEPMPQVAAAGPVA